MSCKSVIILLFGLFISRICPGMTTVEGPGLSYLRAKQHAEMLDMKYVLYFRAEWSAPCQWVEDCTLSDSLVESTIDNDFIFVYLDIDEFEGYALKNFFQVQTLPTTLVFNSNHEMVNRMEGAISATTLLDLVKKDNKTLKVANDNPKEVVNSKPMVTSGTIDHQEMMSDSFNLPNSIVQELSTYKIQLGVFSSLDNANAIKAKASQLVTAPVTISTEKSGEGLLYRVYVGNSPHLKDIEALLEALSFYGFAGIVKTIMDGTKS